MLAGLLLGGAVTFYFIYNNTLHHETTWKEFVSEHLLKGHVSRQSIRMEISYLFFIVLSFSI